jgi:replication fork clamp-binding protein CrfC
VVNLTLIDLPGLTKIAVGKSKYAVCSAGFHLCCS